MGGSVSGAIREKIEVGAVEQPTCSLHLAATRILAIAHTVKYIGTTS